MTTASFQRARKPEEITIRREAILAAAAALFDEEGPAGTGLNAIAARAGFTKSNVYRYFESREAVLLSLFLDDFAGLAADLETALAGIPSGDLAAAAHASAAAFLARPRLCQLLGMLASVLERNVSEAGVVALKTAMFATAGRIAASITRALPQLSLEDCGWVAGIIGTFVSGLWPTANPSPIVSRVLARPELAGLKPEAGHDLERMILMLLTGLTVTASFARTPE